MCGKEIKALYIDKKNSMKTRWKGMNEFLEAESEASQTKVVATPKPEEDIAGGALVRRSRGIVAKHPRSQSSEAGSSVKKKKARQEPETEAIP